VWLGDDKRLCTAVPDVSQFGMVFEGQKVVGVLDDIGLCLNGDFVSVASSGGGTALPVGEKYVKTKVSQSINDDLKKENEEVKKEIKVLEVKNADLGEELRSVEGNGFDAMAGVAGDRGKEVDGIGEKIESVLE
jgi:NADP-dependent 3-hydroxy acid dehydrogenase YdfG